MCTICACYIAALAYNSPIKDWLCIHLKLVFGDPIASGQWRPGISMHLQYISFVYYTYYFSVVLHINIKDTVNLFAQAFAQFFKNLFKSNKNVKKNTNNIFDVTFLYAMKFMELIYTVKC